MLKIIASVRLTVALLSLSMVLIFFGTLDQVEYGIWHTQKLYFESFLVIWKYPQTWPIYTYLGWIHIPMLGGYAVGGLLLANLLAAFFSRFKFSFTKLGINAIHLGLILLLISELLTDFLSVESQMTIIEGEKSNYSQTVRENELVIIDRSGTSQDIVHSISASKLKPGVQISIPNNDLEIKVIAFYKNSILGRGTEQQVQRLATHGAGAKMNILATPTQIDYAEDAINTTTAYIEVHYKKEVLGTWLVSNVIDERFPAQKFQAGEKDLEIAMRYKRHYYPFEIELLDFSHEKYPGTDIPFNYSSKVIAHHQETGADQQALIYMNHPLRYNGLTFYQASFMPDETATILQVVRNPGWLLPYLSVLMMGAGMSFQFSLHFTKFLKKKATQ
ncbi:MAG: cytochrome c biogenesis protein ResB [Verrucomicrobiota bacterium]|nr:cytochrome c biogenesis protein ResB [Verrucomicrobiota bacterium]